MIECMRTEATRKTVTEQRWIPVKYHELTEEERKECLFSADIKYMIDCKLPDDEQEIIVSDGRHVWVTPASWMMDTHWIVGTIGLRTL